MDSEMYAILRVEKLKSFSNIAGANSHNKRTELTPNADKNKSDLNICTGAKNAQAAVKKLLVKHGITPRKNAVLANEYLLSASPDFFKHKTKTDIKLWAKTNLEFLKEKHGEGLITFDLHLDESTPHIHAIVCPIYKNRKGQIKLSASQYFDRKKLSVLQTEYSETMASYGLERGIKNSKAKHKNIKKFYGELDKEIKKENVISKELLNDFNQINTLKPSFINYKSLLIKTKLLAKKLADQLIKFEKLNKSLNNKFESKFQHLQDKVKQYKEGYDQLNRLYAIQRLPNDDRERFSTLERRCIEDNLKRLIRDKEKISLQNESTIIPPKTTEEPDIFSNVKRNFKIESLKGHDVDSLEI